MIIAQGKAAEAAALGKRPTHPTAPFIQSGLVRLQRAKPGWKKAEQIILSLQPRAALLLPWAIITSSLWDCSLARCARMVGERKNSAMPGQARLY